jgi:hypothetical protein
VRRGGDPAAGVVERDLVDHDVDAGFPQAQHGVLGRHPGVHVDRVDRVDDQTTPWAQGLAQVAQDEPGFGVVAIAEEVNHNSAAS